MAAKKKYWNMNVEELADATKAFDKEFIIDESQPLSPSEKREWERAKRKRGRPKVGEGFQRISISIERGLLNKATKLAKKRGVSRSHLIAQSLESTLSDS